jgi:hypothetical protein
VTHPPLRILKEDHHEPFTVVLLATVRICSRETLGGSKLLMKTIFGAFTVTSEVNEEN